MPIQDAIGVELRDREGVYIGHSWIEYLTDQSQRIDVSAQRVAAVTALSQSASIGATALPIGSVTEGLYRLTYYARITTAATTSSSLTISFDWTDEGVSMSTSGAAITGNTTTTFQTGTLEIYSDSAAPIRYSTTYSSTGAVAMIYKLYITTEAVSV
jgi:hypothetical protein